jgi:hypothetical protein
LAGEKSHFDKPAVINHRFYLNVTWKDVSHHVGFDRRSLTGAGRRQEAETHTSRSHANLEMAAHVFRIKKDTIDRRNF